MDTLKERWEVARGLIEHEDGLSNQRMTWLLTLQGFLFTALTLGASTLANGSNHWFHGPVVFFQFFVIVAGALSPALVIRPLHAARRQISAARYWWEHFGRLSDEKWKELPDNQRHPPIIGTSNREYSYAQFGIPDDALPAHPPWLSYWRLPTFFSIIWGLVAVVWGWLFVQWLTAPHDPASKVTISQGRAVDKVNVDFQP